MCVSSTNEASEISSIVVSSSSSLCGVLPRRAHGQLDDPVEMVMSRTGLTARLVNGQLDDPVKMVMSWTGLNDGLVCSVKPRTGLNDGLISPVSVRGGPASRPQTGMELSLV